MSILHRINACRSPSGHIILPPFNTLATIAKHQHLALIFRTSRLDLSSIAHTSYSHHIMPSLFSKIRRISGSKEARCVSVSEDGDTEHSILYQMTCRNCGSGSGCSHLKFKSNFISADTTKEKRLTKILKAHYREVWAIIQENDSLGSVASSSSSSSVSRDELLNQGLDGGGFPSCSLAQHFAIHCEYMENERDALKWLMTNVRVEVRERR